MKWQEKRGLDESSLSNLVFTRQKDDTKNTFCSLPLAEKDHVFLKYHFIEPYGTMNEEECYNSWITDEKETVKNYDIWKNLTGYEN